MPPMVRIWLEFAFCMAVIGWAGSHLSQQGEKLAVLKGLSRSWVGLLLVATVTSLPELVAGVSAVGVAQAPDIAVGNVLGSCLVNLLLIALMEMAYRRGEVFVLAAGSHRLSAAFGVLAMGLVAWTLSSRPILGVPAAAGVAWVSVGLVVLYVAALRSLYQEEQRRPEMATPVQAPPGEVARIARRCVWLALLIVVVGARLPVVATELARVMGWSNSLVGTVFVALATTVPELAATWGALRLGAVDMAMGNLLGSNLFNLLILAVDDGVYRAGPLLQDVAGNHIDSALGALLMYGVVLVALELRPGRRWLGLASPAGWALTALFALQLLLQVQAEAAGHVASSEVVGTVSAQP